MKKVKIYFIDIWLHTKDGIISIEEHLINRIASGKIYTEKKDPFYLSNINNIRTNITNNEMHITMLVKSLNDIDETVSKMISEGKKQLQEEFNILSYMYKKLNKLEQYKDPMMLYTRNKGYYNIKTSDNNVILEQLYENRILQLEEYLSIEDNQKY